MSKRSKQRSSHDSYTEKNGFELCKKDRSSHPPVHNAYLCGRQPNRAPVTIFLKNMPQTAVKRAFPGRGGRNSVSICLRNRDATRKGITATSGSLAGFVK